MKFKILILTYSIFLTGCAVGNRYNEPPSGPSIATVRGSSSKNNNSYFCGHMIDAIDNKAVSMVWSANSTFNVTPGYHKFVIESQFSRSLFSKMYKSLTDIDFELKPNENYTFVGRPEGSNMNVWVINSKGKRITPIASSKYSEWNRDVIILPFFISH